MVSGPRIVCGPHNPVLIDGRDKDKEENPEQKGYATSSILGYSIHGNSDYMGIPLYIGIEKTKTQGTGIFAFDPKS